MADRSERFIIAHTRNNLRHPRVSSLLERAREAGWSGTKVYAKLYMVLASLEFDSLDDERAYHHRQEIRLANQVDDLLREREELRKERILQKKELKKGKDRILDLEVKLITVRFCFSVHMNIIQFP